MEDTNIDLETQTDAIPFFSFNNQTYKAKVVSCHDGDSICVIFYFDGKFQKFKIRLYGIDAPEMKPLLSNKNRNIIIRKAEKTKARLEELVLNKCVYVHCMDFDKYGRILANITLEHNNKKTINDILVEENLAVPYFGDTKQ